MAITTCKDCKNQVSDSAGRCPHCGAKVKQKTGISFWILVVGVIAWLFYMSGENEVEPVDDNTPQVVSAGDLSHMYIYNGKQANKRYKDKLLQVTGILRSISKEQRTGNTELMLYGENPDYKVKAILEKSEESKAIQLSKEKMVTVQCRGKGVINYETTIGDCVILK